MRKIPVVIALFSNHNSHINLYVDSILRKVLGEGSAAESGLVLLGLRWGRGAGASGARGGRREGGLRRCRRGGGGERGGASAASGRLRSGRGGRGRARSSLRAQPHGAAAAAAQRLLLLLPQPARPPEGEDGESGA